MRKMATPSLDNLNNRGGILFSLEMVVVDILLGKNFRTAHLKFTCPFAQ